MTLLYYGNSNISAPRQGDCGFDLYSNEDKLLEPFEAYVFHINVYLAIPEGRFGKVMERSSMGSKGIAVRGGVIDPHYRGTIGVCLHNLSSDSFEVCAGDKIAQIVFIPFLDPPLKRVGSLEELGETERGQDGFGSTGK